MTVLIATEETRHHGTKYSVICPEHGRVAQRFVQQEAVDIATDHATDHTTN